MNPESSVRRCPQCAAVIPADAPQGLCPRCVLLGAATPSEPGLPAGERPGLPDLDAVRAAFPQLEVVELIGAGGMGVVYKARQPKLDRWVALKVLPEKPGTDPAFAERFNREARFLARLSHPGIVTVHEFGQAGPFCYLLLEYVDGVNLRQAMRAGRFSPREALAVVPQICAALQYAHEQGVLHRDIKPENILLDAAGRVKIADFGVAKLVGEPRADLTLTQSGARLGTPHYMAPEQVEKPGDVDHRADIYSLGVVFYEMLTGELPLGRFAAPSAKADLDARIDEIVLRALAKERELRQQSAGEVATQVEGVSKGRDIGPGAVNRPVSEAPSRWPGIRIAGLILLIFAVVMGLPLLGLATLVGSYQSAGQTRVLWAVVLLLLVGGGVVVGLALGGWLLFRRGPSSAEGAVSSRATAADRLPPPPPWARRVAALLMVLALASLGRTLIVYATSPALETMFILPVELLLGLTSVAVWTRRRGWRIAGTVGALAYLLLTTLACLASVWWAWVGTIRHGGTMIGAVSGWAYALTLLGWLISPLAVGTLWHREWAESPAFRARSRRWLGWFCGCLACLWFSGALTYLNRTPPVYQSVIRLNAANAQSWLDLSNLSRALRAGAGSLELSQVDLAFVEKTRLIELRGYGGSPDSAVQRANEALAVLRTEFPRIDTVVVDQAALPRRPIRPNVPLAWTAGVTGLLALGSAAAVLLWWSRRLGSSDRAGQRSVT